MGMTKLNQAFLIIESAILRQLGESQNNFTLQETSGDILFYLRREARPASVSEGVAQDNV